MLGIYINLFLVVLAVLALIAGISLRIQEKSFSHIREFTLLFGITVFFICMGYALMGLSTDPTKAYIPRFVGLCGIDTFILLEFCFLLSDMKLKKSKRYLPVGFFVVYALFDILIHGDKHSFNYIRYDNYTYYEIAKLSHHYFHYSYITVMAITLFITAIFWYRHQKLTRDKHFVLQMFCANFFMLFAAIPDIIGGSFALRYQSLGFCTAFALVYFLYYFAVKRKLSYTLTIQNVSKEIFYTIDIPVLIFDLEGIISLYNTSAKRQLGITDKKNVAIRDLFSLSDVETLRLLAKAKNGESSQWLTHVKLSGEKCILKCSVKIDNIGEPFCLIVTAALIEVPVNEKV